MEATLNINQSHCLKEVTHIGYQMVHNVCTGKTFEVLWGAVNWTEAIFLTLVLFIFGGLALFFLAAALYAVFCKN